ncbi:MAG: DUF2778 domain-containing protein [Pseudomonadota bacterium]|nr:DUF2778 domain-containing protein [Pseudomonadota bacterium]
MTEQTQITLLPTPQWDEESNMLGARVILPLEYPRAISRFFPAKYTIDHSKILDYLDYVHEPTIAVHVIDRGQGRGDDAAVTFTRDSDSDADAATDNDWRKIGLQILCPKVQWIMEEHYPGEPVRVISSEKQLSFTINALLPAEGFRVRSTDPLPHPDLPLDVEEFVSGDHYTGSGQIVVDLQAAPVGTFLWFDGVDVMVVDVESETILRSWPAFSGHPLATASRDPSNQTGQHAPSVGPIPEGLYKIATDESTSRATAESTWDWIKWTIKSPAWGFIATPILPVGDTDTLGRAGIHLHGGAQPGSAGCLDLLDKNEEFHAFLANYGSRDLLLELRTAPLLLVEYLPTRLTTPQTHANPMSCEDGDFIVRDPPMLPSLAGCLEGDKCPFEAAHRRAVVSERPVLLREICTALKA